MPRSTSSEVSLDDVTASPLRRSARVATRRNSADVTSDTDSIVRSGTPQRLRARLGSQEPPDVKPTITTRRQTRLQTSSPAPIDPETPTKPKRRTSITENVDPLEPIPERVNTPTRLTRRRKSSTLDAEQDAVKKSGKLEEIPEVEVEDGKKETEAKVSPMSETKVSPASDSKLGMSLRRKVTVKLMDVMKGNKVEKDVNGRKEDELLFSDDEEVKENGIKETKENPGEVVEIVVEVTEDSKRTDEVALKELKEINTSILNSSKNKQDFPETQLNLSDSSEKENVNTGNTVRGESSFYEPMEVDEPSQLLSPEKKIAESTDDVVESSQEQNKKAEFVDEEEKNLTMNDFNDDTQTFFKGKVLNSAEKTSTIDACEIMDEEGVSYQSLETVASEKTEIDWPVKSSNEENEREEVIKETSVVEDTAKEDEQKEEVIEESKIGENKTDNTTNKFTQSPNKITESQKATETKEQLHNKLIIDDSSDEDSKLKITESSDDSQSTTEVNNLLKKIQTPDPKRTSNAFGSIESIPNIVAKTESLAEKLVRLVAQEATDSSSSDFYDDEAKEGEEDTPSENSNAIEEEGESIDTTESMADSSESYERDSFVVDNEENGELLSGDEDFLGMFQPVKKVEVAGKYKRIVVKNGESDEENEKVVGVEKPEDEVGDDKPKQYRRIQRNESVDSSEEDNTSVKVIIEEPEDEINTEEKLFEDVINRSNERLSRLSADASLLSNTCKKLHSSINVQESINIEELKEEGLSSRVAKVMDVFCSELHNRSGEIKLNVSIDFVDNTEAESLLSETESKSKLNIKQVVTITPSHVLDEAVDTPPNQVSPKVSETDLLNIKEVHKKAKSPRNSFHRIEDDTDDLLVASFEKKKRTPERKKSVVEEEEKELSFNLSSSAVVSTEKKKRNQKTETSQSGELSFKEKKIIEQQTSSERPKKKRKHSEKTETTQASQQQLKQEEPKRKKLKKSLNESLLLPSKNVEPSCGFKVDYFPVSLLDKVGKEKKKRKQPKVGVVDGWSVEVSESTKPSLTNELKMPQKQVPEKKVKTHPKDFKTQALFDKKRVRRMEMDTLIKKKKKAE